MQSSLSIKLCTSACFASLLACAHTETAKHPNDAPRLSQTKPAPAASATPPNGKQAETPHASEAAPNSSIESYMTEHFVIATLARDSVIKGAVTTLRGPLRALADYRYDDVALGGWSGPIAELQQAARLTSDAKTIEQAATGVATIARVCAQCHIANGRGPVAPDSPRETHNAKADNLAIRMYRHMWAADRMWAGLTGPSDDAWLAGASALAHAPLKTPVDAPTPPPGFGAALREVRELGQRASEAATLAERANMYALVLGTCANCHAFGVDAEF